MSEMPGNVDWLWEIDDTVRYIEGGGHSAVALQFPDSMLCAATSVAQRLQRRLGNKCKVYVLADTAYNPLAVDEVAAQHIRATCVIHYGWASLTPVTQLPAYFVFPKAPLDEVEEAAQLLVSALASSPAAKQHQAVVLIIDQEYQHVRQQLISTVQRRMQDQSGIPLIIFSDPAVRSLEPAGCHSGGPGRTGGPAPSSTPLGASPAGCCAATIAGAATAGCCSPAAPVHSDPNRLKEDSARGCRGQEGGQQAAVAPSCTAGAQACCPSQPSCCRALQQPAAPQGETAAAAHARGGPAAAAGAACSQQVTGILCTPSQGAPGSAADVDPTASASTAAAETLEALPAPRAGGCVAGLRWQLPEGLAEGDCCMVWFGSTQAPALQLLQLAYNSNAWLCCEPHAPEGTTQGGGAGQPWAQQQQQQQQQRQQPALALRVSEGLVPSTQALLRRRYFLVEKAKQASIVGVLAGTLAAAGFRDAISLVRRLAHAAGKKTYTFVMGKPNPAKLANFPEVEVWVMVADPLGFLMDCKEYLAPIISPHEAVLAFRGLSLEPGARYPLDFNEVVQAEEERQLREAGDKGGEEEEGQQLALLHLGNQQVSHGASGAGRQLAARDAAEYLTVHRQYKGLETPLTGAQKLEASVIVAGRAGRAAGYADEPSAVSHTALG